MSVSLSLKNICRRFIKDNEEFLAVNNVNLDLSLIHISEPTRP